MKNNLKINCPTCNLPVIWCPESLFKPFCSERCKLIDLGEWARESRIIPGDPIVNPHSLDEE